MKKESLAIEGVCLVHAPMFRDERGFFTERYKASWIDSCFVQDNHSFSYQHVLRGMHLQRSPGQAKWVFVVSGRIYDVVVDLRPGSSTYQKWLGVELTAESGEHLFIPPGCAHGFCVLSPEGAHVIYKVSNLYDPSKELRFRYDDPDIGIEWPQGTYILSAQDQLAPRFKEMYAFL